MLENITLLCVIAFGISLTATLLSGWLLLFTPEFAGLEWERRIANKVLPWAAGVLAASLFVVGALSPGTLG